MIPSRLLCAAATLALAASAAWAGVPYPTKDTPAAADTGLLRDQAGERLISVTVALRLRDADGAEALLRQVSMPGDPLYRRFLTRDEFLAKFGPAEADVERVSASLRAYGLAVERASTTTLRATGTAAQLEEAFSVSLHGYAVPATARSPAYSFHAPLSRPQVPEEVRPLVSAVLGLDTRPQFRPLSRQAPAALPHSPKPASPRGGGTITDPFGYLTVADFAQYYDVTPLYANNITGAGRTLAIVTLANFTPSDDFTYWNSLGLTVDPNRITVVNVDGGPGAPSDDSGSLETTLDTEQSGGIAPGANMIVYMAPNTNQAFVDVFAAAIDANSADTISVSWGDWEWFNNYENAPVTDPSTGQTVSSLDAIHQLFVQAALQGQSLFDAAGDAGAYDVSGELPPGYSTPLSVDYPASDTAATAGGGTTLPGIQEYAIPGSTTPFVIDIPQERVWGWDYLIPLCDALGYTVATCGIFPGGGGGGVSVFFQVPSYQWFLSGVQLSQPRQALIEETTPPQVIYKLPAYYPGRNVPDVSFNADPQTGYLVDYTSSVSGYGAEPFWGGTSFVAPQLNGVTALLGQAANGRLGLLNGALYQFVPIDPRLGSHAPLRFITQGDNWFYHGRFGYSPAAGVGVMNVAKFADLITAK